MKKENLLTQLFIKLLILECLFVLLTTGSLSAQALKLNSVSDLKRVFEDGYNMPFLQDTLKIFGIRGEVISGQCALQTKKDLTDVTVMVSALTDKKTGTILPAGAVEWNFVGSIPLSENTPNQPASALVRQAPARYPDYLMPERQISIKSKSSQAIWLTINITGSSASATYTGDITVTSQQGEVKLPVSIQIYPLTLPEKRNLKVTEWYNTDNFARFHGIDEKYSSAWFAMLGKYAENMVEHRQNIFQVPMEAIDIQKATGGNLIFNFTRFDQIAQVFWDTKKMNFLETGELARFGKEAWSGSEIKLQDFEVKNIATGKTEKMAGEDVVPDLLSATESHLRQKGWLNKTLFHIKDEPSMHNSMAWREISAYIHHYAPDLRRMDAIETTNLLDDIEVAVPKLDAFGTWYDSYHNAQKKGLELWFYTVGIYQGSLYPNKTIDMPVMNSRIMHWLNYRFDATGYLHWGWNQWTEDPYKEVGMHIGDGWHVYPTKEGVVNSLRWEQMRNGIQDYECFMMLENKICSLKDSLGKRAEWIDPKQRGHEITGRVVMTIEQHTDDPGVLYDAKRQLIDEIIGFNTNPMVYVQTTPLENSTLTEHSSVEVFGWTEPGTRIVVNGKELPVSDQGYFFEQFGGDAIDRTKISISQGAIKVVASNIKGTKEIIRKFNFK
jgi:hypothetical protein